MGELLGIDPIVPEPRAIQRASDVLDEGKVIAGPSDTVYGFLARSDSPAALKDMQVLKSRPGPFLYLIPNASWVSRLCNPIDPRILEALSSVWPGPVTVVLPVSGVEEGIAFRIPLNPWLLALLETLDCPLLSSSANPRGEPAPRSAVEVLSWFPDLPLIIDGGKAKSGNPSSLVDARSWPGRLLRKGEGDPTPLLGLP